MANNEGQPNPDAGIVEAALERVPLLYLDEVTIRHALNRKGSTASQIATSAEKKYPAFAKALREGIAAQRGQRTGKHGGKG